MSKPVLCYWDMHGLAEHIRYMLKYADVDFIDKRYSFGEGKSPADVDEIKKPWRIEDKSSLGLDFPNLPYYLDGDIKITQSLAIMRHVGRKYGLFAKDEKSLARQDMIEQQLNDLQWLHFFPILFSVPDFEKAKNEFIKTTLPVQLELLSKFLGEHKWFAGNQLTYVDFFGYETLYWLRLFSPGCLAAFPNLSQLMDNFSKIPQIAAYRKSSSYKDWPIFGPHDFWGYFK